jgi:ectoine hydroxylase-related dioxygenase (phytanoyl-CoA dioxygenase family)
MVKDFSLVHEPISNLFSGRSEKGGFEISPEQIRFFNENGYLSGIKILEEHQIEQLEKEFEQLIDPDNPSNHLYYEFHLNESTQKGQTLFHALGAWRVSEAFHDLLWNPAFTIPASQLLDNQPVRFWHDQLFYKPANHGGVVAWHQDYSYWTRTKPIAHLTCWFTLDDATTENGCMYYVPGSHNWGLLDKPELAGDMDGIQSYLSEAQKAQFKPIPIELKKGFGTFHHPLLVHGSYENKSNRPRRAIVINVFADGVISDSNEELLHGVPIIPKGEKMKGQFFPLLN